MTGSLLAPGVIFHAERRSREGRRAIDRQTLVAGCYDIITAGGNWVSVVAGGVAWKSRNGAALRNAQPGKLSGGEQY